MELSRPEIVGLLLCYFSTGFLVASVHFIEYYKTQYDIFTTVYIEWVPFLFKIFAWPIYFVWIGALIVLILFVQSLNTTTAKKEQT